MMAGRRSGGGSGRLLFLAGFLVVGACAGDLAPAVTTETLSGGGVRVRNPIRGVWDARPESRWRLVEEVRIGRLDGQGPDVFSSVGRVFADQGGRVWVADTGAYELRVFDSAGAYLRTVGRRGDGPGEFSRLSSVLPGPDGNIWVDSGRRWEVFDTSGVWLARHPLDSNVGGGVRAWTDDGRLLEVGYEVLPGGSFLDGRSFYASHTLDSSGTLTAGDTFPTPAIPEYEAVTCTTPDGTGTTRSPLPHSHMPVSTFGPDGDLWITDGGGVYSIRRETLEGDTLLMVEREFEAVPIPEPDMAVAIDQMKPPEGWNCADADPARIPNVYPPFLSYYPASDSTLWVLRDADGGRRILELFNQEGVYQGEIATEVDLRRLRIHSISSDFVYGVAKDDFEVDYIVLLRIEKP